jgi:pseudouridine-5'-phosphate glycosidase
LIANPIPEAHALPATWIEEHIQQSLVAAQKQSIHGKALTPFLLSQLSQHTQGRALESNIALILNNAKIGAQLAVAYHLIYRYKTKKPPHSLT